MSNEPNLVFSGYKPTGIYNAGSGIGVEVCGEPLLTLRADGTVEAPSIEAASEAGRVFVESIRGYFTKPEGSRYTKMTEAELEAEQSAIECALDAVRKAKDN